MDNPFISIVIPAYNEEKRLPMTLKLITEYLGQEKYVFEIIVVDDGSTDGTAEMVREYASGNNNFNIRLFQNAANRGKGFSVRSGVLVSHGDYIFFSDADLSTPIEEIEKLLLRLKDGCDVVFASRGMLSSKVIVREAWYRDKMGKIFGFLVRNLAVRGIRDSQCGFKGFRRETAMRLFGMQTIKGFAFDVEILFIAKKLKMRMAEIPVCWVDSPKSKVNPISDSLKMLFELFTICLNDKLGKYRYV